MLGNREKTKNWVAITGVGVVSPLGNSFEMLGRQIFRGISGISKITRFDTAKLPTQIGGEVRNFPLKNRDVKIDFALAAAEEAWQMAFAQGSDYDSRRSGLSIGLGLELFDIPDLIKSFEEGFEPPEKWSDLFGFISTPSDLCVPAISFRYGLRAPPRVHISACAASTDALGAACDAINSSQWDVALAGGTESMINPMGLGGFSRIGALSIRNAHPEGASSPFQKGRDGFVMGEGASFMVLERPERAHARGAEILGFISGYGSSQDAYSPSDPHPEGYGAYLAMSRAIESSGLAPSEIDAISAHATGTPKNDPIEIKGIKTLFKGHEVPLQATKSLMGHLISASGVVESAVCLLNFREKLLHATANLVEVDEGCEWNHVQGEAHSFTGRHILKNSFGFGGVNACLVLSSKDTLRI